MTHAESNGDHMELDLIEPDIGPKISHNKPGLVICDQKYVESQLIGLSGLNVSPKKDLIASIGSNGLGFWMLSPQGFDSHSSSSCFCRTVKYLHKMDARKLRAEGKVSFIDWSEEGGRLAVSFANSVSCAVSGGDQRSSRQMNIIETKDLPTKVGNEISSWYPPIVIFDKYYFPFVICSQIKQRFLLSTPHQGDLTCCSFLPKNSEKLLTGGKDNAIVSC